LAYSRHADYASQLFFRAIDTPPPPPCFAIFGCIAAGRRHFRYFQATPLLAEAISVILSQIAFSYAVS
jgi:hypothetical protein